MLSTDNESSQHALSTDINFMFSGCNHHVIFDERKILWWTHYGVFVYAQQGNKKEDCSSFFSWLTVP